jgi:hypothetical protein
MEARIVNGKPVNITEFAQLGSTLVRITNHLGLERIPRVIGSSHRSLEDIGLEPQGGILMP